MGLNLEKEERFKLFGMGAKKVEFVLPQILVDF
jgi:hypothetical protein